MDRYKVFIAEEVVDLVSSLKGRQKATLKGFISGLATNPFESGDFPERDRTGRPTQCKVIGNYALSFYSDHAAKEVMVFEINRADRL